jgi:hypothetical protein
VLRGQVIRAGRALLPWDQERLARQAGVSVAAVRELKAGRIAGRGLSAVAAQAALERAGLRFLAGEAGLGRGLRYASARA